MDDDIKLEGFIAILIAHAVKSSSPGLQPDHLVRMVFPATEALVNELRKRGWVGASA